MTTAWLLLLLTVSCQSVDSQSTTDDEETCDGGNVLTDIARIVQTISNRLGKFQFRTTYFFA